MPSINHKRKSKTSKKSSKSSKHLKNVKRNNKTRSNIRKMRGGARISHNEYLALNNNNKVNYEEICYHDRVYIEGDPNGPVGGAQPMYK